MVYVKHLFSFWESGICMPGRGCLHDQLPKPWALSFERASFDDDSLTKELSQLVAEEFSATCVTPLGKDSLKLTPGFPQTLPHMAFPFADWALCHL